jgi:CDP-6-deoxy-D-xylo-4-hexulose-3-dehydrase
LDGIEYDKKFVFESIGHNLEPSELGAAFGLEQLKKLQKNLKKRKLIFQKHINFLKEYPDFFILPSQHRFSDTAWLAFPILINEKSGISRKKLQIYLEKKNIQTRVIFTGNVLRQPGFKSIKKRVLKKNHYNADYIMSNGLLIGCHQGMNDKMIRHVHSHIKLFLKLNTNL